MRNFVCVLLFAFLTITAFSQKPEDYNALMKAGEELYGQSNYNGSREKYEEAARMAKTLFGENTWEYSNAIWSLVDVFEMLDNPAKVDEHYSKVLAVYKKLPQGNDNNIILLTERVAFYFQKKEMHQRALQLFKYAARFRQKTNTASGEAYYWDLKNTLDYSYNFKQRDSLHYYFEEILRIVPEAHNGFSTNLRDWTNYSINSLSKQVFDRVEKNCEKYLAAKEKLNEKDSWYAEIWICYGRLLEARGQFERAINCFTESQKVILPNKEKWGPQYLNSLMYTIEAYNRVKKSDENSKALVAELEKENDRVAKDDYETWVENMLTVCMYYQFTKDYNKAEVAMEKLMPVVEKQKGKSHEEYMNLTLIYSSIVVNTGHTEKLKALPQYTPEYEKALINAMGLSEAPKQIDELGAYMKSGQYLKAIQFFEKWSGMMTNYFKDSKDFETLALTYLSLGYCYKETGNLRKAEEMYLAAQKAAFENLGKKHFTSTMVMMSVGEFYQNTGAWKLAETYYYDAMDILNEMRESSDKAKNDEQYYLISGYLANLYGAWGYYEGAEKFYNNVLRYTLGLHDEGSIEVASVRLDMANLYRQMEIYAYSEQLYLEVEPIYRKKYGENGIQYISMISGLASLYQQRGKYDKAEPLYQKCRDFYLSALGNKSERYIGVVVDLAMMYYHSAQYEKAKSHFKILNDLMLYQADNFFPSLSEKEKTLFYGSTSRRFNTYNSFAVKYAKSRPEEANEIYDLQLLTKGMLFKASNKMRETVIESKNDSLKTQYQRWISIKNDLSKVYQMSTAEKSAAGLDEKKMEVAANDLEKKISTQSELFANIIAVRPTWKTIQQKLKPGEAAVEIVRVRDAYPIYTFAFIGKGLRYDTLGPDGYARVAEIVSDRCAAAKAGIQEGETLLSINGVSTKGKTLTQLQDMMSTNTTKLELKKPQQKTAYTIQVSADSVFERTFKREALYAALILTTENSKHADIVILQNGDQLESRYMRYYQNSIKTRSEDQYSYKFFWEPIKAKLGSAKKIFLSPDGVYNSINLNTLRNTTTGKYVLDENEIVIVSNTSDVLLQLTANKTQDAVLVGFPDYYRTGNTNKPVTDNTASAYSTLAADTTQRFMSGSTVTELPGTKTEVNTIEEILKPMKFNVSKFTAQDASEDKIKNIHAPKILHIATHGFFLSDAGNSGSDDTRAITGVSDKKLSENPLLRSGLLLAGAGKTIAGQKDKTMAEDGILTAYEAMNLDLHNTELVVMSACETGLGQVRSGEGVYGLQRAFRAAGAQTILMSLWKVDDQSTQQLMSNFYATWLKGGDKQHSFREAQLSIREKFQHPYYWGAFVMVGQ